MHNAVRFCLAGFLVLLAAVPSLPANAKGTPKDMFYQELKGADDSGAATVAYCLELHRGNAPPTLCNNRYQFASGDGLRLHIKSTIAGYAYIALRGSSGKESLLYPPTPDEDNRIEPGKEVLIPGKGMIVFDNTPGTEQLVVAISPQPLDTSRAIGSLNMPSLGGDQLSGLPFKAGHYEVMSEDGFYDLGQNTPGAGLVYVTNPSPAEPTIISLMLSHGNSGSSQASGTSVSNGGSGSSSSAHSGGYGGNNGQLNSQSFKTRYCVSALHNDAERAAENSEVFYAFKRIPGRHSGIDCGARDQFVAGMNHLYANLYNQQITYDNQHLFYRQEPRERGGDSGERVHYTSFDGHLYPSDSRPCYSPGLVATFDGMADIATIVGGNPHLIGGATISSSWKNPRIYKCATGHDLDVAWEDNKNQPIIMGVDCRANMFGFESDHFAGHVVVLSERRQKRDGPGRTSNYEYRLLNSWGRDNDGRLRNGWVSADAAASAMNYIDKAHDESVNPHKALNPDELPIPGANIYARGDDGLTADTPERSLTADSFNDGQRLFGFGRSNKYVAGGRAVKDAKAEGAELLKHASDRTEGFTSEDLGIIDAAVKGIIGNKSDDGDRPYPLAEDQKAGILHEANRMFLDSSRIYAQGLDQGDRNRALIAMLHDNANPEHINQGSHNTCNVTTILKVETLLRPAPQAKRFVDMYTNANNDQTVNIP
jgi:hypothetical protein